MKKLSPNAKRFYSLGQTSNYYVLKNTVSDDQNKYFFNNSSVKSSIPTFSGLIMLYIVKLQWDTTVRLQRAVQRS